MEVSEEMPVNVLAASSSEYRRWWYDHHLSREGFLVRIANDAMDCLAQLQQETPDILILETPLHRGGADSVLDVLASDPASSRPRILLVTVRDDAGEIYRVSRHTVDDVLTRVELEAQLVVHLHRLLSGGGVRADSPPIY